MFYPDIKKHISPSALASWHNSRSGFIRSYFKGEKTPETWAMKAGTKIHGLIEAGFLPTIHNFGQAEKTLEFTLITAEGVKVLGKPDSYELSTNKEVISFVDYKTGQENHWTQEDLATDLKMRTTAWLVLQANSNATSIRAIIEWIGTEWNGVELVPTDEEHICLEHTYTRQELFDFTGVILKTINEVNAEYPKFLEASSASISADDCAEYAKLELEKKAVEEKMKPIKERIGEQLAFGGVLSHETEFGTFYFTTKKVYEYPSDLKFQLEDGSVMTLTEGEKVELAMSIVKKNYEIENVPISETKAIGFRAKKIKKNG